ncbi:MAG: hypothetical protein B7X60_02630 [Polynucleobacter sp. 39-45-136]|jgi:predicted DNA-binding protein YlxM (UPF0122 family)|nr:MAG: hypothetical protein B7X60_02630 [Polynucleobacter sp. 39-45-136]
MKVKTMNTKSLIKREKRRMTDTEFHLIRPLLNISENRIEAAFSYLVQGESLRSIAEKYDWSHQAVHDAVGVVWRSFQKYQEGQRAVDLPEGWEVVQLRVPTELADKFRSELADFERRNQKKPDA